MVGGDAMAFEQARVVFAPLSKTLVHHGPAGSGQRAKIVNQVLVAASTYGMCEALQFAGRAGLAIPAVLESVSSGAGGSWSLSNYGPRIIQKDFEPGFVIEHMVKDLTIAQSEAAELGVSLALVELCLAAYKKMVREGHGRKGTHYLSQHL